MITYPTRNLLYGLGFVAVVMVVAADLKVGQLPFIIVDILRIFEKSRTVFPFADPTYASA